MTTTHMLYLHGFRSSPQSAKAQRMARYVEQNHPRVQLWCPQLPPSPREAMALIEDGIAGWPSARMAVVGSSLGGYYASAVAQRMHCKSVMLNPAVDPARDLAHYIGEQSSWHTPEERFFFRAEYIDELRALDVRGQPQAAPELLVAARGDELLDWREMVARYPQAQHIVLPGGDHALSDFEQVLAPVFAFLDLA
ncbi:alpha/beta fold hydrolase [Comamonas faecalis]|uniref:Alpha/beta fold hydrolase n=1 Tax=Comamonas faecalis TaxID=1387849 RepID=A0ABP7S2V2_9BURK